MRNFLAISALALVSTPGCTTEDAVPAYVSTGYQVRCLGECKSRQDSAPRQIHHLDGEEGFTVRCAVGKSAQGRERLSFSARCSGLDSCGDEVYGLQISGLLWDNDGDPGKDCLVRVEEGGNTYEASCAKGAPTDTRRCGVQVKVNAKDSLIRGKLRCVEIENPSTQFTRYLVGPKGGKEDLASFTVQGCEGL